MTMSEGVHTRTGKEYGPWAASVGLASAVLDQIPRSIDSFLDVGCCYGYLSYVVRTQFPSVTKIVGVDFYEPYLRMLEKFRFFDKLVKWDLCQVPLPFKDREFDAAVAIDVVEHLPKEAGSRLLVDIERVAKKVVVTTPNYWNKNERSTLDGNDLQRHQSLWRIKDFRNRGYKVHGIGYRPPFQSMAFILPMDSKVPWLCATILAVK